MPRGWLRVSGNGTSLADPSRLAAGLAPAHGRAVEGGQPGKLTISGADATSLALRNLRAVVILIVVGFHSALAYLAFLGPTAFAFDAPPYEWRAFPIVDSHRWFGFDIFCAWQDVYLMAFMFFLSALFTWPSLTRKGASRFLADRVLRLGLPFVFAVTVVVPLALYPTYAVSAANPGITGYIRHYLALPFLPNGPEWFLWQLLALTAVAAALHRFAPGLVAWFGRVSISGGAHPVRYFAGLVVAAIVAYVPLALGFTPMAWIGHGPFGLQFSRPLLYAVFYFAGLGLGAFGLGRGLLTSDGLLARDWVVWLAAALASCVSWMGLTALAMHHGPTAPLALQIAVDGSFALACASGCFCVLAASLRFGVRRSAFFDGLSNNAFAIYLLHYAFVVWMQYALLGAALPGFIKGMIVFTLAVSLSWAAAAALRHVPFGARLIGEDAPSRSVTGADRRLRA
jgi:glucan biosynthesis protein C